MNLPSADLHENIEKIAKLTGFNPIPDRKKSQYSLLAVIFYSILVHSVYDQQA